MRKDNKIHISNAFLFDTQEVYELTKLQKFICKLFGIEPRCKYRQTFEVVTNLPYIDYDGRLNDIIVFDNDKDQWVVLDIRSRRIRIQNITPLESKRTESSFRGSEAIILVQSFNEENYAARTIR